MKKVIMWILIVLLVLGAGIAWYVLSLGDPSITPAYLQSFEGDVTVNNGAVTEGMLLNKGDSIVTGAASEAVVVMWESVLTTVLPKSDVTVAELSDSKVAMKQNSGSVWSKFTGLVGIQQFEVQLPHTTATVRGTGFLSNVPDAILVGEGTVSVTDGSETRTLARNQKMTHSEQGMNQLSMTEEEIKEVQEHMKKDLVHLKALRMFLINKNTKLVDKAKSQYGVTDDELLQWLAMIDTGELDDAALLEKSPVKLPVMKRMKGLNDAIKEQQGLIQ